MGGEYLDEKGKDQYNPYNLFLILILLILSNDVLKLIKKQFGEKKVHKHKYKKSAKRYKVLPVAEKQDIKRNKSEPDSNIKNE